MTRLAASELKAMLSNSCGTPGWRWNSTGTCGLAQAQGVDEVFVTEDVELADLDVGGREAAWGR